MNKEEFDRQVQNLLSVIDFEFRYAVESCIKNLKYKLTFEEIVKIVNDLCYDIKDAQGQFIRNHF